jgi:type I restriction enzyme R subunit
LAKLRDTENEEYFDSIIVITDRKVVDRQLQNAIIQLNTIYHKDAAGYIQILDDDSKSDDVRNYLNKSVKVIVTTIHKFSRIKAKLDKNNKKYGIIIDEAHSSTASELKNNMEKFLSNGVKYIEEEKRAEDSLINVLGANGSITYFPFTATPKPITKQLFGIKKGTNDYSA